MQDKIYTNSELADLFRQVAVFDPSYSNSLRHTLQKGVDKIKNCKFNIHEHFKMNNTFDGLKINCLGPKMKRIFQLIFALGLEKAQKEILEDKIWNSYHKSGSTPHAIKLGRCEEAPPSWDNIIKKMEE